MQLRPISRFAGWGDTGADDDWHNPYPFFGPELI